jgi:hypothetical protein
MTEDELLIPMDYHAGIPMSTNLHDLRYCLCRPSHQGQNVIYLIGSNLRSFDIRNTAHTAILIHHRHPKQPDSLNEDGLGRYGYKLVLRKYMHRSGFLMGIG